MVSRYKRYENELRAKGVDIDAMAKLNASIRRLHVKLFPEEYDYMLDSYVDAKERAQDHNPMSSEYVVKVDTRRENLGFKPLDDDGMPVDRETWDAVAEYLKAGHSDADGFLSWRTRELSQ